MGAIAGIFNLDRAPAQYDELDGMRSALVSYGSDSQKQFIRDHVGMLHCRMISTPEDHLDMQPITNRNDLGVAFFVFDGRIDNREELGAWLGIDSITLKGMADSAVAHAAICKGGEAGLSRLLGDFALAWWNEKHDVVFIARDPTGVRPLHYCHSGNRFAFASMPAGLLNLPGIRVKINEGVLHDYLMALPSSMVESFFESISKVQPGCVIQVKKDSFRKTSFHQFGAGKSIRLADPREYIEAANEQLQRAVTRRLRSVGLIGSHLSSGLDSSTVTAVAAQELDRHGKGLIAYTASPAPEHNVSAPKGCHADEWLGSESVARLYKNIEHIRVFASEHSLARRTEEDVGFLNQPAFSPADMLWDGAIREDARSRGVRTILSSHMGDLTISYSGIVNLASLLGQGRLLALVREAWGLRQRERKTSIRQLVRSTLSPHYRAVSARFRVDERVRNWPWRNRTAASGYFLERVASDERIRRCVRPAPYRPWRLGRRDRINYFNRLDSGSYFALDNAYGIERRDPTADRELIDFYLSIPEDLFGRRGQQAGLLKEMMSDNLPLEILEATSTGYQAADWHLSVLRDRAEIREMLEDARPAVRDREYLDLAGLLESLDGMPIDADWCSGTAIARWRVRLLQGLSAACFVRYTRSLGG